MTTDLIDGPRLDPASGGPARQLVIFVHGYGSNGEDLISLAVDWRNALPDAAFASPNAPEILPMMAGAYQWWDFTAGRGPGIRGAAPHLDAFIDAEQARLGLTDAQTALVGFSQGTMMALHVGPRRGQALAGVLGYSGAMIEPESLADEIRSKPAVFLIHGKDDDRVPYTATEKAGSALTRLGVPVEGKLIQGLGHGIDPRGVALGRDFLKRVLIPA